MSTIEGTPPQSPNDKMVDEAIHEPTLDGIIPGSQTGESFYVDGAGNLTAVNKNSEPTNNAPGGLGKSATGVVLGLGDLYPGGKDPRYK